MTQLDGQPGRPAARSRAWLLPLLLVIMIAVPIVEVWGIVEVGRAIGGLPTVLILIAEAALGSWLMKREGARAWKALNAAYSSGRMPTGELANAALILVGGILLMLPGFFTDIFGLFFLLPFTRPLARRLLGLVIASRVRRAGVNLDVIRARVDQRNNVEGEAVPDDSVRPDSAGPSSGGQRPDDDSARIIRGEVEP